MEVGNRRRLGIPAFKSTDVLDKLEVVTEYELCPLERTRGIVGFNYLEANFSDERGLESVSYSQDAVKFPSTKFCA